MLEQKLISTDGLDGIFGLYLVWYNGVHYRLTECESKDAEKVRQLYPHWIVYLSGDTDEDVKEIKRQTFLTGDAYKKCLYDIGLDEVDEVSPDDLVIYLRVSDDLEPFKQFVIKGHEPTMDRDVICSYAATDANDTKVSKIIAGCLEHGFDLEIALAFVIQLGYKAQDRISEELRDIAASMDALTV